jgi:hypothetical protein
MTSPIAEHAIVVVPANTRLRCHRVDQSAFVDRVGISRSVDVPLFRRCSQIHSDKNNDRTRFPFQPRDGEMLTLAAVYRQPTTGTSRQSLRHGSSSGGFTISDDVIGMQARIGRPQSCRPRTRQLADNYIHTFNDVLACATGAEQTTAFTNRISLANSVFTATPPPASEITA